MGKELTAEELEERERLFQHYYQEALHEPMDYFSHDTNALDDDALYGFWCDLGYEGTGMYWRLVELLSRKKGHTYSIADGYMRLAHDLCTTPDVAENFVSTLVAHGLLNREQFLEKKSVGCDRVYRNAEGVAEKLAKKRMGAALTNRAKGV